MFLSVYPVPVVSSLISASLLAHPSTPSTTPCYSARTKEPCRPYLLPRYITPLYHPYRALSQMQGCSCPSHQLPPCRLQWLVTMSSSFLHCHSSLRTFYRACLNPPQSTLLPSSDTQPAAKAFPSSPSLPPRHWSVSDSSAQHT
jgi:hypothetical protein